MPLGRIAFTSDGNLHDSDDWGAMSLSLAFIHYAGLEDRFVHYDYNNHMGNSRKSWEKIMDDVAKGGAARFGLDTNKVFDDQTQKKAAIANFVIESKKSSKSNPLWLICAGPMQMAYDMINASPESKRKFTHLISHSAWNEKHSHDECKKTWTDLKNDFPTVQYFNIQDQNRSNEEDDFQSNIGNWQWLKNSENKDWQWLYEKDDTHEVDDLENWNSHTKYVFDVSDAGMTYWLITGGPNGGNEKAGWKEAKALLENKEIENNNPTPKVLKISPEDYVFIEAESTTSDLNKWKRIKLGFDNYIPNASGYQFIEFLGNDPEKGEPNSPITYSFKAPKDGKFRLLMLTSKRLEGARGDQCNDAFVKLSGDFISANKLPIQELTEYIKYFQEGSTKTPELSWNWAIRAEKGTHEFHNLIYELKKGQEYVLTLAGRSQRFSVDYLLLYDADKFQLSEIQNIFKSNNQK